MPELPEVEGVVQAAVAGGQDARRAVHDDAEVADHAGVQDLVQDGAVRGAAFREPGEACAGGRREWVHVRLR